MFRLASATNEKKMYEYCLQSFEEMLNAGITCVGEFHFLHHSVERSSADAQKLYDLDAVVLKAASDANIRIVLLQTYYQQGGLGSAAIEPAQRHFLTTDTNDFWRSVERLDGFLDRRLQSVGVAAHSVRAVSIETISSLYSEAAKRKIPFHIHLEEQPQEIQDCLQATGKTPSQLLLETIGGDACSLVTIVHATHTSAESLREWIRREANVCICPLTEGNLGDGIFVWPEEADLHCCLGTDSNRRICFTEEMRWLTYLQQVRTMQPFGDANRVFRYATKGGARSLNLGDAGELKVGNWADFFTLQLDHPSLTGWNADNLLSHFVYGSSSEGAIGSVCVGGRWRPTQTTDAPLLLKSLISEKSQVRKCTAHAIVSRQIMFFTRICTLRNTFTDDMMYLTAFYLL